MRVRLLVFIVALALSQAGCRAVREAPTGGTPPPQATQSVPAGYTRYRVIPAESEVRALVYRDGLMARLGHNHVLNSRALQGDILVGSQAEAPRFTLVLPVASFSVDDAALRVEEGEEFPGVVDAEAIAGTRKNLLSEALLDGATFPEIRLTSRRVLGVAPDYAVTVAVEVKGRSHELQVPVLVEQRAGELRVSGQFTATHADLGLTPFSVMGGLLSVRDEIRLRFRIVARP
ncbi:MAG: YceI family protein [Gammaproteobacteria bacterium]